MAEIFILVWDGRGRGGYIHELGRISRLQDGPISNQSDQKKTKKKKKKTSPHISTSISKSE